MAVTIRDLKGKWDMVHDDWKGVLEFNPTDQNDSMMDGPCIYSTWVLDGTWTGSSGQAHWVRGYFQGFDQNRRTTEQCKDSQHLIKFTIAFDDKDPQPFEGYIFTWEKNRMAGFTWWRGIPFGWYAIRRQESK